MTLATTRAGAKASGALYYFTGKPCPKGHFSKRKTSNSGCWACKKKNDAERRKTPAYRKMMRGLQAKRRSDPAIKSAELQAQGLRRRTPQYREEVRPFNRKYKKENRGKYNAYGAKRDAAKVCRTPSWLTEQDKGDMLEMYEQARRLTKTTGIPHHVDHKIPLQGVLASGFHTPSNLQILTASENMRKSNRFRVAP